MTRELLFKVTKSDFTETHIRGSGPGGQNRNKTSTGVRLVHKDSGAVGEATDSHDQPQNRTHAFKRLRETPEWKRWFHEMVLVTSGRPSIDEEVAAAMDPKHITVQHLEGSKWVTVHEG